MRILRLLLVFVSTATCAANGSFILPPARGPEMMKQCSRSTPKQIEKFWMPDQKDIAILETRLADFLATGAGSDYLPFSKTRRQFIGFIRGGTRYIYGNFYPPFEALVLTRPWSR